MAQLIETRSLFAALVSVSLKRGSAQPAVVRQPFLQSIFINSAVSQNISWLIPKAGQNAKIITANNFIDLYSLKN